MRRSVVTGIGVVAPGGTGRDAFWSLITSGRPAIRRISFFDPSPYRSQIAAECDFDPAAAGLSPREERRCDRYVQFALAAAEEAVGDAGLAVGKLDRTRLGVVLGSAVGATMRLEDEYVVVSDHGRDWLVDPSYGMPFLYEALIPANLSAEVATRYGAGGPAAVISTGCTSGIDSIGHAHQLIQDDEADVIITGASESPISPISVACFDAIRATTPHNERPEKASRPFDADRAGFVLGEGCAVLVLEELDHALRRGAPIYCEVAGFGNRANGFHMTGLRPDGIELAAAITDAMSQAKVGPSDIGYVSAHGSGTKQNDRHETAAYKRSLGQHAYKVPISSIKSMIGHSLGAIGSIEMATCALVIRHGIIPPTANLSTADPDCDLDYVPTMAREQRVDVALSAGSGFGGFQSAMVFAKVPEQSQ
ncbi:MAG: minimal ketosynthase alpha [Micromonosporaceae bacterium]|nr:minimal ketosynthase alpha [Micromonosporaceae bacterium]